MKSPVYGPKRGRTRRPRVFHAKASNYNLKGKKTCFPGCYCCTVINKKDELLKKEHVKEMREYG